MFAKNYLNKLVLASSKMKAMYKPKQYTPKKQAQTMTMTPPMDYGFLEKQLMLYDAVAKPFRQATDYIKHQKGLQTVVGKLYQAFDKAKGILSTDVTDYLSPIAYLHGRNKSTTPPKKKGRQKQVGGNSSGTPQKPGKKRGGGGKKNAKARKRQLMDQKKSDKEVRMANPGFKSDYAAKSASGNRDFWNNNPNNQPGRPKSRIKYSYPWDDW